MPKTNGWPIPPINCCKIIKYQGFCCNACKCDYAGHIASCTGFGHFVSTSSTHMPPQPCIRNGCPFQHKHGGRAHGFCCNACRRGDPREWHTCNSPMIIKTLTNISEILWTCKLVRDRWNLFSAGALESSKHDMKLDQVLFGLPCPCFE